MLPVPSGVPLVLMLIFFLMMRRPPSSSLFPYTTLFRSRLFLVMVSAARLASTKVQLGDPPAVTVTVTVGLVPGVGQPAVTKTKPSIPLVSGMVYVPGAALKVMLPEPFGVPLVLMLKVALTPVDGPFGLAAKLKIPVPPRLFLVMVSWTFVARTVAPCIELSLPPTTLEEPSAFVTLMWYGPPLTFEEPCPAPQPLSPELVARCPPNSSCTLVPVL